MNLPSTSDLKPSSIAQHNLHDFMKCEFQYICVYYFVFLSDNKLSYTKIFDGSTQSSLYVCAWFCLVVHLLSAYLKKCINCILINYTVIVSLLSRLSIMLLIMLAYQLLYLMLFVCMLKIYFLPLEFVNALCLHALSLGY